MTQRVRSNAFHLVLHVSLTAYCFLAASSFTDDPSGRTADLVQLAGGVFGTCALFYGVALWLAWLDADDERQARWEAQQKADDNVG